MGTRDQKQKRQGEQAEQQRKLEMSRKERARLEVLARVRDGEVTLGKAAGLLGLSRRQVYRVYRRYEADGDAGLVHGLRGRASNRKTDEATREAVLRLYREKYADFGPTLAAEKLSEADGLGVNRETLRGWLVAEGLWAGRRHRKRHRSRRERKACRGEMVQVDGSPHDWFEGRRGPCVLMEVVDDATGTTYARFFEEETTRAAFETFAAYARRYGVPRALYADRDSIYRSDRQATVEEELRAESPPTQFGRAMRALGVELILANSPQAKGRVERKHGVMQDRLVKELRLRGLSTIDAANEYLDGQFLAAVNRKFAVEAKDPADLHVPLSEALAAVGRGARLDEVLCWEEQRVVQNDWCVQWRNRVFQLTRRNEALGLAGRKVTVREKLDGSVQLLHNGLKLHWKELEARPHRPNREAEAATDASSQSQGGGIRGSGGGKPRKPAADHPWRRPVSPRGRTAPAAPPRSAHAGTGTRPEE